MSGGPGAAGHPTDGEPREAAAGIGPVDAVDTTEALAALLRQLRRRAARRDGGAQPTYRQLSARTGWAHGVIGDYFAGKTLPPTDRFDTLVQLLGATGRELRQLATARDRVEEARRARMTVNGRPGPPGTDHAGTVSPVPRQLPADISELPGRIDELAALDVLRPGQRGSGPVVVALDGPGGVGKSALAVHAAHRLGERFPDGQLYADLRGSHRDERPVPPAAVLRRFLCALGEPRLCPGSEADAAAAYRTLLTERRMLIVLDNAMDAAQVRPLLPAAHGCAVLVTSLGVLATLNTAVHLHLSPLSPPASIEVLGLWAGPGRLSAERGAAELIAHHCGHLPWRCASRAPAWRHAPGGRYGNSPTGSPIPRAASRNCPSRISTCTRPWRPVTVSWRPAVPPAARRLSHSLSWPRSRASSRSRRRLRRPAERCRRPS